MLLQKTIKEYPVYITSIGFVFYLSVYPQQVSSISCWGFLRLKNNSFIFTIFLCLASLLYIYTYTDY